MTSAPQTPTDRSSADRIVVTIPGDEGFEDVAQLVLAGVAARLNLTYESLDDLGTALATLLERRAVGSELTVELWVSEDIIIASVGPFAGGRVLEELERHDEGVGLRRVLETVVDSYGATAREGAQWIELEKRVDKAKQSA
jgi:hypothetical protein